MYSWVNDELTKKKEVVNNIISLATHPKFRVGYDYCNVGKEDDISHIIESAWQMFGSIDIYFSNAGIFTIGGISDSEVSNDDWQKIWEINCMSHIFAARFSSLYGKKTIYMGHLL